ncbi:hypothetical protein [Microbacterium sp. UBA3394]|uniref:hypothetical protein n=1 Tax=Microbacterium sp. UBA3394 TaxID=1946945 RepID=UPI000C6A0363|nr:hypothetical protein [Microbacterium sp. UBA3394]MAB77749.1 hypothetical protein [Planctomycetota bacterium]MAM53487.1 hypothetical protein [Microbacterium sp.]
MLEILLATAPTETPPTVGLDGGAIAALIFGPAVVAAFVSGAVTLLAPYISRKLRRDEATEAAAREMNVRALNEFYSPIRELLNEVKVLRDEISRRVNKPKNPDWHTLDHVPEIKADKVSWALFDAMVQVNLRIKQILDEKSGLARGAVTASGLWRVHQSLLARALANPEDVPSTELSYFPTEFETQINAKFDALSAELDAHSATDKKAKKS